MEELYELAEGVHVGRSEIRFYGFRLETRMAAIRLPGERLLLYSPTWLTDSLRRELARLGRVAFVVSPNKIHNQTLGEDRSAYPTARILAPPGLPERRPELEFDAVLGDRPLAEWSETLDQVLTDGNVFFREVLLFHRPSGTLLVGDLVENLEPSTTSCLGRWVSPLFGIQRRPMPSPEFRFYTHDAAAAERSLAHARRWPIPKTRKSPHHRRLHSRSAVAHAPRGSEPWRGCEMGDAGLTGACESERPADPAGRRPLGPDLGAGSGVWESEWGVVGGGGSRTLRSRTG